MMLTKVLRRKGHISLHNKWMDSGTADRDRAGVARHYVGSPFLEDWHECSVCAISTHDKMTSELIRDPINLLQSSLLIFDLLVSHTCLSFVFRKVRLRIKFHDMQQVSWLRVFLPWGLTHALVRRLFMMDVNSSWLCGTWWRTRRVYMTMIWKRSARG